MKLYENNSNLRGFSKIILKLTDQETYKYHKNSNAIVVLLSTDFPFLNSEAANFSEIFFPPKHL